jgi:hypothetical protein
MKDNRKIEELDIGTLQTLRRTGDDVLYSDGSMRCPAEWQEEKEPLNLGSMNHPKNTDVLQFKMNVPSGENFGDFLGKMLGGRK